MHRFDSQQSFPTIIINVVFCHWTSL